MVCFVDAVQNRLNRLTDADVFAEDLLFATLDPTMRMIELPGHKKAVLSDTVGFISDLPTDLIAAFRATLEEVLEATLILHVRDIASDDSEAERLDVLAVLEQLGVSPDADHIIEVLNKSDLMNEEDREVLHNQVARQDDVALVSSVNGQGVDELLEAISEALTGEDVHATFDVPHSNGEASAWLYRNGDVTGREDNEVSARLDVTLTLADVGKFRKTFDIEPIDFPMDLPGEEPDLEDEFSE